MANGTCPVGASNATNIAALTKAIETACHNMNEKSKSLDGRVSKVEAKQDWIIYLLIGNLVAVVIGYIT
jgi:hypothetical protein